MRSSSASPPAPTSTVEPVAAAVNPLTPGEIRSLNERFQTQRTEEILAWAWGRFGPRAAIGTSFQGAGLVMIHVAKQAGLPLPVFTLDTGLLFPETLVLKKTA